MTRIDTRMSPAEAARWWRIQTVRENNAKTTPEGEYLAHAGRCSVAHGRGKVGERHMDRVIDGRDVQAVEFYHQGHLVSVHGTERFA